MKTYLSCIPCFFQQVLQAGEMAGLSQTQIKDIMNSVGDELKHFSMQETPPSMAKKIQKMLAESIGNRDPYKKVKDQSNEKALSVYPELKRIVAESDDKLLTAVELACAGNIIDYGVFNSGLDVTKEIMDIIGQENESIAHENSELFAYKDFTEKLASISSMIYIGDNTGEIVFDRVLIETIAEQYPSVKIYFATRGKPILNDCLVEDAYACGLDKTAEIVSSGVGSPGLILDDASDEFKELFFNADMIISKGQGNYEALSGTEAPIFYLLITKCKVIAQDIGSEIRDLILRHDGNL